MVYKRGEIYYISKGNAIGSEQDAARPGIIVSNDAINRNSGVLEVVYLTTRPKSDLPTHVEVHSTGVKSIALCEQINSVSVTRIGDYVAKASAVEMAKINDALLDSLGIDFDDSTYDDYDDSETETSTQSFDEDAVTLRTERDLYKKLYEQLIDRLTTK